MTVRRSCEQYPPAELLRAIEEFNRGDWFDSHETFEDLWRGETGEMRDFYQGLLQVAVGLHHWRKGYIEGAVSLLGRGAGYLRRVRPVCQEVDVAAFIAAADRMREALITLGPEQVSELETALVPRLRLVDPARNRTI
jgi:predicted metal-dependent hydrolase